MSDVSRRDLLRNVALSVTVAGAMTPAAAQHVHEIVADDKQVTGGVYKPKAFTDHEYATVRRLCDLIFPADAHSKGALDAGAPEFIDLLSSHNNDMSAIYTGGIGWLDHQMQQRYQKNFVDAAADQQTALLDQIAYRKNMSPELGPGIQFFDWIRKMTSDAYYTSRVGIDDLGYMGNKGMAKFEVPEEAIQYALKRSGL